MDTGHLTNRQVEILKSLNDTGDGENKKLFDRVISGTLPIGQIEAVCQLINNEYLMKGIKEDYKPNTYGRELEDLLNIINKPRISG